jgi:hypothetical protein
MRGENGVSTTTHPTTVTPTPPSGLVMIAKGGFKNFLLDPLSHAALPHFGES